MAIIKAHKAQAARCLQAAKPAKAGAEKARTEKKPKASGKASIGKG